MASTHKSLRSGTANKRPTTSIADGQIALNTNTTSPGLFFKDSTGATIIKVGPVHVGTTAPNASPAAGGSSGNSTGEVWLDTSLTPNGVKIWNGASWTNATPIGSTTVQGLLELATNAETQTGTDPDRAVTPAGLQSKVSDSTSTTSSTTIASSTAVKSAYDLANAALPKSGGTVTGNLEIGTTGSLSFEGATADAFETTIAVVDPTADRTITLPDTTGTVVTTGDTGTVTSTMIADGTIVNGDINASAAIAGTKISPDFGSQTVQTTGIFSHALGTAGAPTVTFTGDTNTGIYSPGADQVAISTGGSGRLFINSTGDIQVGAASTLNAAVLSATANPASKNLYLAFNGTTTGADFLMGGISANANGTNIGAVDIYRGSSDDHGYISFRTKNGTTLGERVRITATGSVGVGTSSPTAPLHVVSTSAAYTTSMLAIGEQSASTGRQLFLGMHTTDGKGYIQSVHWGTAYKELLLNPNGGNVGIGTISPSSLLHVEGTAGNAKIRLGTGGDHTLIGPDASGHTIINAGTSGGNMQLQLAGTTKVTLTSTGLGIGTTSPQATLHAHEPGSVTARIRITNSTTTDATGRGLLLSQQGTSAYITNNESGELVVTNNGSEAFRVDSSRRLLVGTSTSALERLVIKADGGGIQINRNETGNPTSGQALGSIGFKGIVSANSNAAAEVLIQAVADEAHSGSTAGSRLEFHTKPSGTGPGSSPTERVRITSSGNFWINGNNGMPTYAFGPSSFSIGASGWSSGAGTNAVKWNSGTGALTYDTSSRLIKDNIEDCPYGIEEVKRLQPRKYLRLDDQKNEIGFIADEVFDVMPEFAPIGEKSLITKDEADTEMIPIAVNYEKLSAVLTKALQEAVARIEQLEAAVATLQGQ